MVIKLFCWRYREKFVLFLKERMEKIIFGLVKLLVKFKSLFYVRCREVFCGAGDGLRMGYGAMLRSIYEGFEFRKNL